MSLLAALLLEPYRVNVWIAHRSDGIKGSGTVSDPYDGSSATKFDALMNSFAALSSTVPGTRVNLGPGVFETSGYSDVAPSNGWQPKAGMKIIGSGMDVTTLKLVNATTANEQYFAVGHSLGSGTAPLDFFEINDLTVDCNLASAQVAVGAVRIKGNHSRIRRLKVINWGTKGIKGCHVIFSPMC